MVDESTRPYLHVACAGFMNSLFIIHNFKYLSEFPMEVSPTYRECCSPRAFPSRTDGTCDNVKFNCRFSHGEVTILIDLCHHMSFLSWLCLYEPCARHAVFVSRALLTFPRGFHQEASRVLNSEFFFSERNSDERQKIF